MRYWAVLTAVRRADPGRLRAGPTGSALSASPFSPRPVEHLRPTRFGFVLSCCPIFVSTPWVDCPMTRRSALERFVAAVLVAAPLAAMAQTPDTPGISVRADLGPTPRIKAGEPERAPPSGNPLWAIPLKDLSDTRERPIFTPSRRPPPPPVVEQPYVPPPPPPVATKPPPEPLMLSLLGTIAGDSAGVALFMQKSSQDVVRLRIGEAHQGWVLRSVHGREAMLEKGDRQETVMLPSPGDAPGGAAASGVAAMQRAPPMMPGAPEKPGAPAKPAALGMPGAPRMPAAPGMAAMPDSAATLFAEGRPSSRR
jgi:hypothetical protein